MRISRKLKVGCGAFVLGLVCLLGAQGAAPGLDPAMKARIEALDDSAPAPREALIREALVRVRTPGDRLWLLDRLARALAQQQRWPQSLEIARQGQALAVTPADQVGFALLVGQAELEVQGATAAYQAFDRVAPLLPALAAGQPASQRLAGDAYQFGGATLAQMGRLPEAMDCLTQAMRIFDALQDGVRQAQALHEVAMVHFRSERMEEAVRTEQRAIEAAEASGRERQLSGYYSRLSHYQSQLGQTEAQHQSLLKAERLARQEGNDYNLAVVATNLADVALQRKDYVGALRYADLAIPLVERSGDTASVAVCWINRGIALNRLRRGGGIPWIERGYEALAAMPSRLLDAAMVQGVLAEEHAFNGDWERAYRASQRFRELEAKQRKVADLKRMAEAEAAYQADKKQRQIEALQRDQQVLKRFRMLWLVIGVLGLGIALVLVLSRRSLRKAYRAMKDMALQDPLTGLKNRRYLAMRIEEDLALLHRQQHAAARQGPGGAARSELAFLMIDMDHFKAVNDVHGHAAGDAVLVQMATILRSATRETDRVVRWGGEEFLVMARLTGQAEVHQLAERIRARVEAHTFDLGEGQILRKTCSLGFAGYPMMPPGQPPAPWESVVALADQCLYLAKASGRNVWVGALPASVEGPRQWDLGPAVAQGQVELLHPPGVVLRWPEESRKG